MRIINILFEEKKDGEGGGGGSEKKESKIAVEFSEKDLTELKTQNAALLARLEKLEGSKNKPEEKDLNEKVKEKIEADDKKNADAKVLESALTFNLKSEEFLKNNASLLPKDITEIFKAADKEKYESAIEKTAAIKAGVVQSFFSIQSNLDLLTPSLKTTLEDYLKLTKNGKQDKAQQIYETIFEPSLEMLRRIKKAEALNKGYGVPSETEDSYKNKMMALSKKHYLGEKSNA